MARAYSSSSKTRPLGFAIIPSFHYNSLTLVLSCLPHSETTIKLAAVYAALVLGLLTFTKLLTWTLGARMHELGSGDVQTVKLAYNVDPGKRHQRYGD